MPFPIRLSIEQLSKSLSKEQLKELGFPPVGVVEISKLEEKTWVLSFPSSQTNLVPKKEFVFSSIHEKVLHLLQTHKIADLIEGRFEKLLSAEELSAFEELKKNNRIVCIKTSPRFEKGIYRESNGKSQPTQTLSSFSFSVSEKLLEEYSLLHDGFMVLRSDGAAKAASFDLSERIKNGEVKGIKSFDGFYYIIENSLLQKFSPVVEKFVQIQKKVDLPQIAGELHLPLVLVRIAIEFLKEEGIIIEKKKNLFAWVG